MADPPYGEFDGYTADGFDARDHRLLAGALRDAVAGGMGLIGFNAPGAATLYHWAKVEELTRSGCVSSKATDRDPVAEIVITAGLSGSPSQGALQSSSDAQRLRGGGSW
jgi:site-specific DNA-adenine methylase